MTTIAPQNVPVGAAGLVLAGYRLVTPIGEGGMGVIWRGQHVHVARMERALKIVRAELAERAEFRERFLREAEYLELLRHENILRVENLGLEHGVLFMVMELLTGSTLEAHASGGSRQLDVAAAVGCMVQALAGLAHAHDHGIIHRDLKPANLFLTTEGKVKLLDFGIARHGDASAKLTQTGAGTPGSPAYYAPEFGEGAPASAQSDIYALGITLYELLTGRLPFEGGGGTESQRLMSLLLQHATKPLPDPRTIRPELPGALVDVVIRATAKDPAQRYISARAFAEALCAALEVRSSTVAVQPPTGSSPAVRPVETATAGPASITRFAMPDGADGMPPAQGNTRFEVPRMAGPPAPDVPAVPMVRRKRALAAVVGGLAVVAGVAALAMHERGRSSVAPDAALSATAYRDAGLASGANAEGAQAVALSPADAGPRTAEAGGWVRIEAPRVRVVLGVGPRASADETGFRPERAIVAPSAPYALLDHEVTWGELEPYLAAHLDQHAELPTETPMDPTARKDLPATGMPWTLAQAYCESLGGALPTEEQWEYAARGEELRSFPWGSEPVDPLVTNAYRGKKAAVLPARQSPQDRTPDPPIFDLAGNAQEWTASIWREDLPDQDESWTTEYRAVRGLPLAAPAPRSWPRLGAAHREPFCATGGCSPAAIAARRYVGFRCARPAR